MDKSLSEMTVEDLVGLIILGAFIIYALISVFKGD